MISNSRSSNRVFVYEPEQVVFRPKLVTVDGAIAKPGTYRRNAGMKISDAIAGGGRRAAFGSSRQGRLAACGQPGQESAGEGGPAGRPQW